MKQALRLLLFAVLIAAATGAGRAQGFKAAWDHYDECARTTASFRAMVACGKARRTAACTGLGGLFCGPEGDAVVAYADSLVQSLNDRTMTEAQARRRWLEFVLTQRDRQRTRAFGGPTTCIKTGSVINCY